MKPKAVQKYDKAKQRRINGCVSGSKNFWRSFPDDDLNTARHFALLQGPDALTLYQFNNGQARHYFCKHCGIYTFRQRSSSPHLHGVNVVCIEGTSPFDFAEVVVSEEALASATVSWAQQ